MKDLGSIHTSRTAREQTKVPDAKYFYRTPVPDFEKLATIIVEATKPSATPSTPLPKKI